MGVIVNDFGDSLPEVKFELVEKEVIDLFAKPKLSEPLIKGELVDLIVLL